MPSNARLEPSVASKPSILCKLDKSSDNAEAIGRGQNMASLHTIFLLISSYDGGFLALPGIPLYASPLARQKNVAPSPILE